MTGLETVFKDPITQVRMPQKNKGNVFLLFIGIVLLFGALFLNEVANRFEYANNSLTENDFRTCIEEIQSVNYVDCRTYLIDTNQKDFAALLQGIPGGV